jgi:hypothetical protein
VADSFRYVEKGLDRPGTQSQIKANMCLIYLVNTCTVRFFFNLFPFCIAVHHTQTFKSSKDLPLQVCGSRLFCIRVIYQQPYQQ